MLTHLLIAASSFVFVVSALAAGTSAPSSNPNELRAMTFNLRFGSPIGEHSWLERRSITAALLKDANPDLFGTQEGLIQQLKDMQHDLGDDYAWIGVARNDGKEEGEHSAIFYRKSRLEVLEVHNFWLSDTPEVVGSKSWGNHVIRMATWAKLRDKKTGQEFYCFNTHLDHQVEPARQKGAALIRDRIDALKTDLPVIVTGDFNCGATSVAHKTFMDDGFKDTWDTARENKGPMIGTYHGYKPPKKNGERIDWILTKGKVECDSIHIDTFEQKGEHASDHFPVMCELRFVK